ncbi:hypothetical protein [Umezakia ovalisporum]|uniref:hypothetical protein n=1 Tax=Umezakia ovalisporum TaxID=75695 RepID=UPI0035B71101
MPTNDDLENQAREKARSILSKSQSFQSLNRGEQFQVYKNVVDEQRKNLVQQQNLSEQSELARGFAAADLLRKQKNDRIDQAGGLIADAARAVDFPGFVRDLLTGVFDANLDANERQMQAYRNLLKEATREVSSFVNDIDDESAMYRLVQDNNQFQLSFPDENFSDSSVQNPPTIKYKDGQEIPSDEIKAKILDTKLAMAKERRTLLRETLLMGISRLVVEKGTIKANVEFKITTTEKEKSTQQGKENVDKLNQTSSHKSQGGFWGWGGNRSSFTASSERTSQVSIAASTSETSTDLSAKLQGSVEIQFKSDYFKLDNFTQIFDLGERQVPQGAATQPQQLPTDGI